MHWNIYIYTHIKNTDFLFLTKTNFGKPAEALPRHLETKKPATFK